MIVAGSILFSFQPSASRTPSQIPANPSDESLGYFQSSANADSGPVLFCAKRPPTTADCKPKFQQTPKKRLRVKP